mgnify:CR=1 FL=1
MRPSRDEWAQALARETARRATCLRRKVGCVLLSARGHVLATGYNGVAMGMPHCDERLDLTACWCPDPRVMNPRCPFHLAAAGKPLPPEFPNACPGAGLPSGTGLDLCEAVHAEQNALLQCRDAWAIDTCHVTVSPCVTCAKLLLNTSCLRVMFDEDYPQPEAGELWRRAGRLWEKAGGAS